MRSILRSRDHELASTEWYSSERLPGVRFQIRKVTLGQRIELAARIRELCLRHKPLCQEGPSDEADAVHGELLIRRLYLEWGLAGIEGLKLDGVPATTSSLIEFGPEDLADEAIELVRAELGLTEAQRKNF
jgi:hypothetical protein